ncbi:YbjQ family protein [Acinetobacter sp. ANC 3832]|uniref:YbjQ family protein n=1 Tax=Acinetobacter sp. ANC 3832 TaxID=1977874 RepID=UPI000A32D57B|nr:heavy metal-binding domain-containing protein [Acinetobacter sp. ANC 3832]OTG93003.1 metal-binding protein [Acinetobacter sp. ANC 3832]
MDGLIFKIILTLILFCIGWLFGRHIERKHLNELEEKEARLGYIRLDTNKFQTSELNGQLVSSNVVISHDYFKYIIAQIQNFFGGRLSTYENVVDRARREAVVRLKLEAEQMGAKHIMGLRLSTTELGMQGGMVEVFAYGTAIIQPH